VRPVGLYDPAYEHDACGVAFVARLDGVASHETLVRAATALANLEHRGAEVRGVLARAGPDHPDPPHTVQCLGGSVDLLPNRSGGEESLKLVRL